MASRPQKGLIVLLFVALGVLLLLPVPEFVDDHYLMGILQNAGHAPGFAILTYACLYFTDARDLSGYLRMVVLVLVFAVATEILQHFTHRQFSLMDIGNDAAGIVFGLAIWLLRVDLRVKQTLWLRRLTGLAGIAVLVLMLAPPLMGLSTWLDRHARFPVLLESEMADVLMMTESLGKPDEVDITLQPDHVSIDLLAGPRPGVVIKDFVADWQGYETLVIEVARSGEGELFLELYVRDKPSAGEGSDWFFAHALIETDGWHQLRFTLDDIKNGPRTRAADLSQISAIAMHRRAGTASRFSIRKIYLQ
jgi:hypothetical protein